MKIKLGYEIGTGKQIDIDPSHMIVTGLSQKAGKTTTLESLIKRSGMKAIVFRTKIGEKSFLDGTIIPPYFKEKSDWQYIESLISATMQERVGKLDRAIIIQLAKKTGGKSLLEFKKVVDERLEVCKTTFETMLLTNLQAYLEIVLPKLQTIQFSSELELVDGLNIINLERFSRDSEVQSLIISGVLEEILHNHKGVICLIPEAWKFIPQKIGNPCKSTVEEFIRQGATNKNFIWIDSQDIAGVDKTPLKQISEWVLGYQSEKNEVEHTIDQIPLPKIQKPKPDDVMILGTGIFYYASRDLTAKIYVQPFWLDDETSIKVAKGEINISEIDAPKQLSISKIAIQEQRTSVDSNGNGDEIKELKKIINKELLDIRTDFFNKIGDLQDQINKGFVDIGKLQLAVPNTPEIDEDLLVSNVLQKMPISSSPTQIDMESIIREVTERIPPCAGINTYTVSPLEKIKKDFIAEAKKKILEDVAKLTPEAKKILKYIESRGCGVTTNELCTKCFMIGTGGPQSNKAKENAGELITINVCRKDTHGKYQPELRKRITDLLAVHDPTDGEIDNLYSHIIVEMTQ